MNAINKVYQSAVFENKRILCAIVDQTQLRSRHPLLFKKMKDITQTLTFRRSKIFNSHVKFFNSIDDAMSYSSTFDLVIIQNIGNFITHNVLFEYIDTYWKNTPEFFLIAFTLDWDAEYNTGWLECHHQMMVVNPVTWKKLGSPKFGNWEEITDELPTYSRSLENFHDQYTPYWIEGGSGTTIARRTKQGWGFLKAGLSAGIRIDNFSKEMRDCRLYVYPESNSDLFYNAFLSNDTTELTNPNQIGWIDRLDSPLKIWIFNSEMYQFTIDIPFCETYFGPAAGFKYLNMLKINPDVKYVIYDFNQHSLDWIKKLKDNWDGNNLLEYLQSQPADVQSRYQYVFSSIEENEKILYQDFGGEDEFKQLWLKFKNSDVTFIQCNLLDDCQVKLLLREHAKGKSFFYFSNIFATDHLIYNYSLKEVQSCYEQFNTTLSLFTPLYRYGTDTNGNWISGEL